MKVLNELWPPESHVYETLGTDAHSLDEAVFLAVHQPMRFRKVPYGQKPSGDSPVVDERQVLKSLLADVGEGRVIIPIAGESGVGKSHVIKWLQAELLARADAVRRHVILVPKSSSLKSVLRRILEDLDGPRYDQVRARLERASESLPEVVARDLRTRLVSVLKSDARSARERLRNKTSKDRRADERSLWGRDLANLLDDPELWGRRFYGDEAEPNGVVARLAANVTREGSANRRYQFESEDFEDLVAEIDPKILSPGAARVVKRFADETWRESAAAVLNGVLDRATQNLLDLGGTPLSEVFLDLRKALLEDGKELVILVEDFAVLSGMQGALLDALIHEARVGGKQKYCTIRSALAYTHGYQPMDRDTVQTRARFEWIIEDTPGSTEDILARAVEMVGAYLNAARWGVTQLHEHRDGGPDDGSWIRVYEGEVRTEEERRTVEVFGRSSDGYPLFPFNEAAIRALTREKCRVNDRMVFNPRLLIDRVVLDVLKFRRFYESGNFPPTSFGSSKVTAPEITNLISDQRMTPVEQQRTLTLVTYWADVPETKSEAARVDAEIYEAFGIAPVDFGATPPKEPKPKEPPEGGSEHSNLREPNIDPFTEIWGKTLDTWQRGETLQNKPARLIRNAIRDALFAALPPDWPGTRPTVNKDKVANFSFFLPNARGARGLEFKDAAIALCSEEEWNDSFSAPRVRERLEAVIRFQVYEETKHTWDWDGGEKAAALYANFVDEHRAPLMRWLAARRVEKQQLKGFTVPNLVENRLLAAALLGTSVKGGNHFESALDVLFCELDPPRIVTEQPEKWRALQLEAADHAERARRDLFDELATYQGSGSKVYAIDIAHIEKPARDFMKRWELSDGPSGQAGFKRAVRSGVRERRNQLQEWRDKAVAWMGDDFDKQAFIDEVREMLNQVVRANLIEKDDAESLRRLLTRFKDTSVKEALREVEVALREPPDGISLPALAYDDVSVAELTLSLGDNIERMLDRLDRSIDDYLEKSGAKEVERVADVVRQKLDGLGETLDAYDKVRSQ